MIPFQAAVEGNLDEAVLHRVVESCGGELGIVYGRDGKNKLHQNIRGYNNAARFTPWVVLVDLDDAACASRLRAEWLPDQADLMCFRVAVREIESWLIADRANFANFIGVSRAVIPGDPDGLDDPKAAIVQLATRSRKRSIREGVPPAEGSRRAIGALYNPTLSQFVSHHWDPEAAAQASDSLQRCLKAIATLSSKAGT